MTDVAALIEDAREFAGGLVSLSPGRATRYIEKLADALAAQQQEIERWRAWPGGSYPDNSPGDVIAAYPDGTIVLDDGITTWNPLRALAFLAPPEEGA